MDFQAAKAYLEYRGYTLGEIEKNYWLLCNPIGKSMELSPSEVITQATMIRKASKITERSRMEEPIEEEDNYGIW